jgi:hypothetical protein
MENQNDRSPAASSHVCIEAPEMKVLSNAEVRADLRMGQLAGMQELAVPEITLASTNSGKEI